MLACAFLRFIPIQEVAMQCRVVTACLTVCLAFVLARPADALVLVKDGQPVAQVVVDVRGAEGANGQVLKDAASWLAQELQKSSGATLPVAEKVEGPALVVALASAYPEALVATQLAASPEAYAIVTLNDRLYLLGNSAAGTRHAVAHLLRHLGFRYFAPSPTWHVIPRKPTIDVDLTVADAPALVQRSIWYAYGQGDQKELQANYQRWAQGNRLSTVQVMATGHSYAHIIGRNEAEFAKHPEYFALLENGERDTKRAPAARKFCTSNAGLIELVVQDRIRLLEENRKQNPLAYMVSVDPSDGQGTCLCDACAKLGTTTDRVFHLANAVAQGIRAKYPDGWVGLYAYSSHRLPPTIAIEPNVYVQVAMGFNRTQYSLPELVEKWSEKVGAIGLREYYGVEAWDWGLPGRMRGSHVDYHRKWIPYYAQRKLNAINAETNANWGAQSLGLYVAAAMMWDSAADVDALVDEYFQLAFAEASEPMRELQKKFDQAPPLRPATISPLFEDLAKAYGIVKTPAVKARLIDLMAYLEYVAVYREFELAASREPSRNNAYYDALRPLMQYAWQIRGRDTAHYYALARRLTNGLPVADNRLDFYLSNKEQPPVWMTGEQLSDADVIQRFEARRAKLAGEDDPNVAFSRFLEPVRVPGDDAGPSQLANDPAEEGVAAFRQKLIGYLPVAGKQTVELFVQPTDKLVQVSVFEPNGTLAKEQTITDTSAFTRVAIDLPRANDYRVEFVGDAKIRVPATVALLIEASAANPAWLDMSGPMYFYVPGGTKQIIVDADPRLSVQVPGAPGAAQRIDIAPAQRLSGKQYAVIEVPQGAAGRVWHTTNQTRGKVMLLNVPPLLSLHRGTVYVPREVAEGDRLTTSGSVDPE
jgi:hypothetical protein